MLHQVLVSHLVGGAGIVAIRLAAAARGRNIPIRAWVPGSGPASEALERERVEWWNYDLPAMRGTRLRHLLACGRMLPGLLQFERPVVHVHNPLVYRYLRPALLASRAKVVVHFQIEPDAEEIRWTLEFPPDHVVACAGYIADRINKVLGDRARKLPVTAVPNGVDVQRFRPGCSAAARERVGISSRRFVLLMLANLAPHKGQATVLRALHILSAQGEDVECWLVGEDRSPSREFERELRSLCSEFKIEHLVRFLGFRSDAPDLLQAADAFLLPSTHEGLPLSIVEAQASELPVLGSNIPGILEVVKDGVTGFVVPAEDAAGYADRIRMLIRNPAQRQRVVNAAAAQARDRYSWSTCEEQVFSIYSSLLRRPPAGLDAPAERTELPFNSPAHPEHARPKPSSS